MRNVTDQNRLILHYNNRFLKNGNNVLAERTEKSITFCGKQNFKEPAELISKALKNQMDIVKLKKQQNNILHRVQENLKQKYQKTKKSELLIDNLRPAMLYELISDMISAAENKNVDTPPSILISGYKTSVQKAVNVFKEHLSNKYNILEREPEEIADCSGKLRNLLENNKNEYLLNGKRTIIVVKDIEKVLSVREKMLKGLGIKIKKEEKDLLGTHIGGMVQVSSFKALLDTVSKIPESEKDFGGAYATTFLFTSENPHLIHPDLLTRPGKMTHVFCNLPKNDEIKDTIIKNILENKPEFEDYFSESDWKKILKILNPNSKEGGFSIEKISSIISKHYKSIANRIHFNKFADELNIIKKLLSAKRDIEAGLCKKIEKLSKNFQANIFKNREFSIEDLMEQSKLGILTPKLEKLYKDKINHLEQELEKINTKIANGKVYKKDLIRKNKIEKLLDNIKKE